MLKRLLFQAFRPGVGRLRGYPPRVPDLRECGSDLPNMDFRPTKITIVVPSRNQGQFLGATIRSILDQAYPNLELIVVDGASTDNSVSVIKAYESHLSWWVSEPDDGQAAAINKGFSRATGDIMAWINSDDLVAPFALWRVARFFQDNPAAEMVYGNRLLIDEVGNEIGKWILPGHSHKVLKWADFVPQETLYWKREFWNSIGGKLDEAYNFALDWEFLLRSSSKNVDVRHLPIVLGMFRVHESQKTSSKISSVGLREMNQLRLRELGFEPSPLLVSFRLVPFLLSARWLELRRNFGFRLRRRN